VRVAPGSAATTSAAVSASTRQPACTASGRAADVRTQYPTTSPPKTSGARAEVALPLDVSNAHAGARATLRFTFDADEARVE